MSLQTENRGYPQPKGNLVDDLPRLKTALNKIDNDIAIQHENIEELKSRTVSYGEQRLINRHPHLGSILNGNT